MTKHRDIDIALAIASIMFCIMTARWAPYVDHPQVVAPHYWQFDRVGR